MHGHSGRLHPRDQVSTEHQIPGEHQEDLPGAIARKLFSFVVNEEAE
jgi:hypothetical protein